MKKNLEQIIRKYKKGRIQRRELLRNLNPIILKVPHYMGYNDKDIKQDYYVYIISKIDKIIKYYEEYENASFKTWITIILKREFINFIKRWSRKTSIEIEKANDFFLNLVKYEYTRKINNPLKNIDFSFLSNNEKNIIALKYGINICEKSVNDSVNVILDRLDKKKRLEERIARKYFKIIDLQRLIIDQHDNIERINLQKKESKLKYYKRKLEKKLMTFNILPTNRWVGNKLGLSEGTIASYLNRIKAKMLKKYSKVINEELINSEC